MAQIISITSEALQATIRRLLPSQVGFGEDLQASNVIQPIIDLTPSAEGTITPELLQTALAFGSQTGFTVSNTTTTVANTAGFWRIIGTSNLKSDGAATVANTININDGLGNKQMWGHSNSGSGTAYAVATDYDFVVFLRSNDSLNIVTSDTEGIMRGSVRQIADVNGNLVEPSGFTPQ